MKRKSGAQPKCVLRSRRCGVSFAELPASKQWAALSYSGKSFAGVWFKPEGEPFGLSFRLPLESFQIPAIRERLTIENLLKAVGLEPAGVESWTQGEASHA